ncbi:MAG: diaminopimelate epimerase [Candidatus Polarisedimenticolia bacterium]
MTPPVIKFTKMSASGNDFIVIDNLTAPEGEAFEVEPSFVRRVCGRKVAVGADGVIVVSGSSAAHARMTYFNADGGRAALCGNGVRCVARLLVMRRVAPSDGLAIETDVGVLPAAVEGDKPWFRLPLGTPKIRRVSLDLPGGLDEISRHFEATLVEAGVPHLVIETRDAHAMSEREFLSLAPRLRRHPDLGPEGANVDFFTLRDGHTLDIRCYERGVEGETLSSGSGCISAALTVVNQEKGESPVACRSRAGFTSTVTLMPGADGAMDAVLSGDARVIYTGVLHAEAMEEPSA